MASSAGFRTRSLRILELRPLMAAGTCPSTAATPLNGQPIAEYPGPADRVAPAGHRVTHTVRPTPRTPPRSATRIAPGTGLSTRTSPPSTDTRRSPCEVGTDPAIYVRSRQLARATRTVPYPGSAGVTPSPYQTRSLVGVALQECTGAPPPAPETAPASFCRQTWSRR